MSNTSKPVFKANCPGNWNISTTVWPGAKGYSCSIQKRYKNKDGEYVESKSFYPSDLPLLKTSIDLAVSWMSQNPWSDNGSEEATTETAVTEDDVNF